MTVWIKWACSPVIDRCPVQCVLSHAWDRHRILCDSMIKGLPDIMKMIKSLLNMNDKNEWIKQLGVRILAAWYDVWTVSNPRKGQAQLYWLQVRLSLNPEHTVSQSLPPRPTTILHPCNSLFRKFHAFYVNPSFLLQFLDTSNISGLLTDIEVFHLWKQLYSQNEGAHQCHKVW